MKPNKEIEDYVQYLNGRLNGEQHYILLECEEDLFKARKVWDLEYYTGFGGWSLREEKFVDKEGKEWYLLLNWTYD